jgi:dihydroorotate dehydrogenase
MVPRDQMGIELGEKSYISFLLDKIFSKTSRPILIKLDANYPCMKEIQVCLNKG